MLPLPYPRRVGRIRLGMPVLSTKMIPSRQARLGTGGRPPLGDGFGWGSKGVTAFHNAFETCRLLIVASVGSSLQIHRMSLFSIRTNATEGFEIAS